MLVTKQELQEDAGILDKACRYAGNELASGGLAALESHVAAVTAMLSRFRDYQQAVLDSGKIALNDGEQIS